LPVLYADLAISRLLKKLFSEASADIIAWKELLRTEVRLASRAAAIQSAAINQTFSKSFSSQVKNRFVSSPGA
jgi:hypothetical protein